MSYVLSIDAGTTGITVCLYDLKGNRVKKVYSEFPQYYPKPGWVEQDGQEIWETTKKLLKEIGLEKVKALGITNQRETVLFWDKTTGKPLDRAIVWQCRRTKEICEEFNSFKEKIWEKTGLLLDAYFSATKMTWLLRHSEPVRQAVRQGKALAGTVDTWLLWNLTGGKVHATDTTNASRTMLYHIHRKEWDSELLELFAIPEEVLPKVYPSAYLFGELDERLFGKKIPIGGIAGDQQAALFGQKCVRQGECKNTYGTGCFLLLHTGDKAVRSQSGMLTTLVCDPEGRAAYGLEGSVFVAGALLQWLRDEVGLIKHAAESEELAQSVPHAGGVHILPALVGMGAPYWKMDAKGAILGLSRGTTKAHIVRAALESIAYQTKAVVDAMQQDTSFPLTKMRVDGGVSQNNFLMQFQADLLQIPILRPKDIESTSRGAAYLAGLSTELWKDFEEIENLQEEVKTFSSSLSQKEANELYLQWKKAVEQLL